MRARPEPVADVRGQHPDVGTGATSHDEVDVGRVETHGSNRSTWIGRGAARRTSPRLAAS